VPFFTRLQATKNESDKFRGGYVNFDKLHTLANIVKDIQTYQKVRYAIQPLKTAHDYLMEALQLKPKAG